MFLGCDVHEWPDPKERLDVILELEFDTDMTQWHHLQTETDVEEVGVGPTTDNARREGTMRYIVRAYPETKSGMILSECAAEYVFVRDISEGYNCRELINLPVGQYSLMVWADLIDEQRGESLYSADNFEAIRTQGDYEGCNDLRDAFRAKESVVLVGDIMDREPDVLTVQMRRPMAKIEIISNDLMDFMAKEEAQRALVAGDGAPAKVKLEDYKVVLQYVGYVADSYSIFSDLPPTATQSLEFESVITPLNDEEASLAFDYLFVRDKETYVTVRIALYTAGGELLSVSPSVDVPIKRDHHSILRHKFLTTESSGGIGLDPGYEDDFNIIF